MTTLTLSLSGEQSSPETEYDSSVSSNPVADIRWSTTVLGVEQPEIEPGPPPLPVVVDPFVSTIRERSESARPPPEAETPLVVAVLVPSPPPEANKPPDPVPPVVAVVPSNEER